MISIPFRCASALVPVVLVLASAEPAAQATRQRERRPLPLRREQPDDPPGRLDAMPRDSGPTAGFFTRPAPVTDYVQVNVVSGANVWGDAANEPSIAVDPTNPNRMAIGWRQFDTVASNFRQAGYAYSSDGGASWTAGTLDPGVFRSDPILDFDAQGNFYYNSLTGDFACWVFVSSDGGMSWGGPMPAFGGDKAWMAVDRTAGIGAGNVYSAWSVFAGCCGDDTFTRSTDGALTFETPTGIALTPIFGTMDVGPDGSVYVGGVDPDDFSVFLAAKSTNAQNRMATPTFTTVVVDLNGTMGFGGGPNPAGLLGQANIAADPTSNAVYMLCSVDPPDVDPLDVFFARSVDGGATWSAPVRVNDDPVGQNRWQWFGTMDVAPNGRIDVVWNDTRKSNQVERSQTYYSFSTDGGLTWAPNRHLTPIWNSHVGFPDQDKIGDYYDMVSTEEGAHLAFSTTLHGEQDVYYLFIEP